MQPKRTTIQIFQNSTEAVAYPAGTVIFKEGDAGDAMYVVKSGEIAIEVGGKQIETLKAGDILGEMALLANESRSATARTLVDSELVAVTASRFEFLVQQTPFFALDVMRIMAQRLRAMNQRV